MGEQHSTPETLHGGALRSTGEDTPAPLPGTAMVRVRYFAGARAAAGVPEEQLRVRPSGETSTASVTVADVVRTVLDSHDEALARVVASCGFLVDGVAVREDSAPVADGAEFDVLPPFAGG